MKKNPVIELKKVSKLYPLNKKDNYITALNKVDLSIYKGDYIGIIGNNGSGKTTLLKTIAKIIRPTSGEIICNGKVVILMNLETGFNLELSGRENIFLNGLLIGMSSADIKNNVNKIINYSGIKNYIDEPFYTYSSGMKFRLAFSIAIMSNCDVLIIDEVLTVGDFDFQKKVFRSLKKMRKEKKEMITIVCSHIPDFIWGFSNRFLLMNNGNLKQISKGQMLNILKKKNEIWKKILNLNEIL